MELGKRQVLKVARIKDFGAYLVDEENEEISVLLPKKELNADDIVGSEIEIFLYKDSKDRLIATKRQTKIELNKTALLEVKDIGRIGVFLDIGLEKEILLPYKEMTRSNLAKGDKVLVALYKDRSDRLACTMRVYPYLIADSPYDKDDDVRAIIYQKKNFEYLAAVDEKYYARIPNSEVYEDYEIGKEVYARVIKKREDGKLDISPRKKAYIQLLDDAEYILQEVKKRGGSLGFDDKADKELIKKELHLSKNAMKRAVGTLLKERKIELSNGDIKLISD